MVRFYLETSALAKRYILEEGTSRILELIETSECLITSRLTLVEVASAAVRRAKAGDISGEELLGLLHTLEDEFRTRFDVIELGGATITRSIDLIRVHALRAADGIQLACALIAASESATNREFLFVSADVELNAAAEKEGLTVLDPQTK